jgi:DNA transposition AAA+ family ATPase
MMNNELKFKIVAAIKDRRKNFPSDSKMAIYLGINTAQYSRLVNKGEIDSVISDAKFITIARKLDVRLNDVPELKTANTPVFQYITTQLENCQRNSISGLFCDIADIGKTHAAKWYVREHKNAIYVDCSQNKRKTRLIRYIAKEYGLNHTGRYDDVYEDLVFYLNSIPNPIVILDEAGDLDYAGFLELKALWNATEHACAWYMMGADGLKVKIENNLGRKKVGYAEIFRRFGGRYQRISPMGKTDLNSFTKTQVSLIAKANGVKDLQRFYEKTGGSLTRIYVEIQEFKRIA